MLLWLNQFQVLHPPYLPPPLGICLLISKLWQMPHSGASLCIQMSHGRASERVQKTNLRNKKTIITHQKGFILAHWTCTFFFLSSLARNGKNCTNICTCWNRTIILCYFKSPQERVVFANTPPPGWPSLANTPLWGRRSEKMSYKSLGRGEGGMGALGIDRATNIDNDYLQILHTSQPSCQLPYHNNMTLHHLSSAWS